MFAYASKTLLTTAGESRLPPSPEVDSCRMNTTLRYRESAHLQTMLSVDLDREKYLAPFPPPSFETYIRALPRPTVRVDSSEFNLGVGTNALEGSNNPYAAQSEGVSQR